MTRRPRFVHNLKLPSCFHRLRISLFFSPTRSSHPCLRVAVCYKSGWICAQLPFSVPRFRIRRSLYSSLSTFFHCCRISLFLSSTRSSFTFLQARRVSYHFSFCNSIFADLSTLQFRHSFIVFASRSFSRRLFLPLRHPLSSLSSVHQRPLVFVCFRRLSRAP